jgi:hypothetical protein
MNSSGAASFEECSCPSSIYVSAASDSAILSAVFAAILSGLSCIGISFCVFYSAGKRAARAEMLGVLARKEREYSLEDGEDLDAATMRAIVLDQLTVELGNTPPPEVGLAELGFGKGEEDFGYDLPDSDGEEAPMRRRRFEFASQSC